ncbi:ABC transporter substrate-binding protein [Actinocrinis puniceicyclus]|uniref:ABC transporter substrate-binding protein n=1 Tax=Actinocrinis puniceicyclus TaxID=977794 RepID=A0A8J7WLP2_9ACTN|nr:ABC transporter substrate-binding protein [Actinocrinis puniceicyclus]MBS2963140.1 ABC transporter substrate-binding protein [Actinocrinis puniceicyclus]
MDLGQLSIDLGRHRRTAVAFVLASAVAGAAACSSSAPAHSTAGASGGAATTVTLALDWTPNTNHTGIFVAQQLGYFKAAGIDLRIVPYGSTAPETLVATHKADFGISYQDGLTEAAATGQDITSVFAITQKTDVVVGVRADSGITSPKQLDGKTYAGYGSPLEAPMLKYVIRQAGGTGTFKNVTLNTDAYQALYAGQADFALPEPTWEVIQARLVGKPLRTFELSDYGFPAIYSALIASSHQYLTAHAETARKFLAAVLRGYQYATDHPQQAANLLIQANQSALGGQKQLVDESANLEAAQYYKDAGGKVGVQSQARWQALTDFLYRNGILADASGKALAAPPQLSTLYTNAYLPASDQSP